jgi:hypothetical protein
VWVVRVGPTSPLKGTPAPIRSIPTAFAPLEILRKQTYFDFRSCSRVFALRVSICLPATWQANWSAYARSPLSSILKEDTTMSDRYFRGNLFSEFDRLQRQMASLSDAVSRPAFGLQFDLVRRPE